MDYSLEEANNEYLYNCNKNRLLSYKPKTGSLNS